MTDPDTPTAAEARIIDLLERLVEAQAQNNALLEPISQFVVRTARMNEIHEQSMASLRNLQTNRGF